MGDAMSRWYELLIAAMNESSNEFISDRFEDKMCTVSDAELHVGTDTFIEFTCWGRQGWLYVSATIDGNPVVRRIRKRAPPDVRKPWMLERANAVVEALAGRGVEAKIIGSLANGDFGEWSDADFLILKCPSDLIYHIENEVEEIMCGEPFDVVYADNVSAKWLGRALARNRK